MVIPTLNDIAKRNQKLCALPAGINESDYLEDEGNEDGNDIIYPMPEWMNILFNEFKS